MKCKFDFCFYSLVFYCNTPSPCSSRWASLLHHQQESFTRKELSCRVVGRPTTTSTTTHPPTTDDSFLVLENNFPLDYPGDPFANQAPDPPTGGGGGCSMGVVCGCFSCTLNDNCNLPPLLLLVVLLRLLLAVYYCCTSPNLFRSHDHGRGIA